jgi:hypothetical protein
LCPDLKVSYTLDRDDQHQDSLKEKTVSNGKIWKPQADDVVVDAVKTDQPKKNPTPPDTPVARIDSTPTTVPAPPLQSEMAKITESFSQRKEVVTKTLDVESDSVRISFYDNGEVDGDSISVFVNKNIVLTHQELAAKALTMYLHLDSAIDVNEVSMFAENLGKYPPNTALMVVTDGKNRYEIFMSSSLTENATIQIRRKKGGF